MRAAQRDGQADRALVEAAQRGDRRALDELLAQHLPLVYNIVGRPLDGHQDVDDVVQETLIRAVDRLGDQRDPSAFHSWLVAIAVRQVRDRWRAVRRASGQSAYHRLRPAHVTRWTHRSCCLARSFTPEPSLPACGSQTDWPPGSDARGRPAPGADLAGAPGVITDVALLSASAQ